ncbi:MAG: hypothetical protein AB9835_11395 [Eubacteriales bacterium]
MNTTVDISTQVETASETNSLEHPWEEYLPKKDFEGYNFRIFYHDAEDHISEVWSENETGEILNDSVYKRNSVIEDAYNITITPVPADESNSVSLLNASILSGSDDYDFALVHMVEAANMSLTGVFLNWLDMPYVDLEKPWWSPGVKESLSMYDVLFLAAGDFSYADLGFTMALAFNKEIVNEYGLKNPYELVKKGEWTIDEFNQMVRSVSSDLNGDGLYDDNDLYGLSMVGGASKTVLFFGAGQFLTQKNKDGLPELCLNTDKTQYLMDFFYDLFFNDNQTLFYVDNDPMEKNWTSIFEAGRILFVPMQVNGMERLRNMANDFGMLPFPKYDSVQEKYYSMVNGHAPMLVLPNTISDPDRTGLIIEALAAESSVTVKPTYAEIVTKVKYSRDNDTSLMIDYILDSRTYDFGYVYTGASGMGFILTNLMDNKSKNFTSAYEKIESNTIKQYEKVIETYRELSSS